MGFPRRHGVRGPRGAAIALRDNSRRRPTSIRADPIATMSSPVECLETRGSFRAGPAAFEDSSRRRNFATGNRDARCGTAATPCPSIGALPALQLIVRTRNSRPFLCLSLFLKVSRHVPPPPTASAPMSFAALPPDNPRTHDRLGATRDAAILSATRCFRRRRPTCRPDPSRLDRDPVLEGGLEVKWRIATGPSPMHQAEGRRCMVPSRKVGRGFCFASTPSHRRRRFRTFFPLCPALRTTLSASTDFQARTFRSLPLPCPCLSTESRTQPLTDDDEDRVGGEKQSLDFSRPAVVKAMVEI